ncbi:MAG TPA: glycoside hydrolase family 38 C-terminal domain-containing protein, partial [bacterium]|nr:glycoside hydrolase family 38 C-terminal domain-containing protein [bacterium]
MPTADAGPRDLSDITVHMVGYAHLDPVWLWQWTEGYQEARATFRSALDRMNEFPGYVFSCTQAAVYAWVEENDPAMFREIVRKVAEGRWCLANGWWMEPDCNLPCGESFARHGLYGQRWLRERFGMTATVCLNADSFGHHAMMPQLVRKSGMDSYMFMRPSRTENPACPFPAFRWRSPDGSSILAYRLTHNYETWGEALSASTVREAASWARGPDAPAGAALRDVVLFFGVGNHGGGPTKLNLASIVELQGPRGRLEPGLPGLAFSSPQVYFQALRDSGAAVPDYQGEWQHHASGCYSVHSEVKRLNRRAENELVTAEKLSVIAGCLAGWQYKGSDFTRAWRNVLFCQFHDILAGTCIREAYDDVRQRFGESLRIASQETNGAAQRMAAHIDTRGPGTPVVVFNPHSFAARTVVECDITREASSPTGQYRVTDEAGQSLPSQLVQASAVVAFRRHRVCFEVDLPAGGYRTCRILPAEVNSAAQPTRPESRAENQWFSLEIDPATGCISRLLDKSTGADVFSGPAAVPLVIDDPSDTWSHGIFTFRKAVGSFHQARVRILEDGAVRTVIRARSLFGASAIQQDFILHRNLPWISVRVEVEWHEKRRMLKLAFPVNVREPRATWEVPYGALERPTNGEEQPGQKWMDVTGVAGAAGAPDARQFGLGVLNDGLYSSDASGSEIRLTVLRSPVYAHHDPAPLVPDEDYHYMDQGLCSCQYELVPHAGSWQESETVRRALLLNAPPVVLTEHVHDGGLPPSASHVKVGSPRVIVTALKVREGADDIVVRAHEATGQVTHTSLELPFLGR